MIKELQKKQQNIDFQVECIIYGEQQQSRKKALIDREQIIMTTVNDKENRSVIEGSRTVQFS